MGVEVVGQREWVPPDQLKIRREKGWGYKYTRKDDVQRRLDEGWEIVPRGTKVAPNEVASMDSAEHYRGLILMRAPKHFIEKRNQHYRDMHHRRLRAAAVAAGLQGAAAQDPRTRANGSAMAGAIGKGLESVSRTVTEDGLVRTGESIHIGPESGEVEVDPEALKDLAQVKAAQAAEPAEVGGEEVNLEEEARKGHQPKNKRR